MSHTPGPWDHSTEVHVSYQLAPHFVVCGPVAGVTPETDANARLIAAAPDLLAALKGLRDDICYETMDAALTAIAKAEGK